MDALKIADGTDVLKKTNGNAVFLEGNGAAKQT
jgi:hypothetical protein